MKQIKKILLINIPTSDELLRISRDNNIDEMFDEVGYILDGTDIRVHSIEDKMKVLFGIIWQL